MRGDVTEVLGGIMGDISIHSPSYEDGGGKKERRFERTQERWYWISIHPLVWGETRNSVFVLEVPISIHSPRMRGDGANALGVGTNMFLYTFLYTHFYTLPSYERRPRNWRKFSPRQVSIPSLRIRGDQKDVFRFCLSWNFYTLPSYEGRLFYGFYYGHNKFLYTPLVWGEIRLFEALDISNIFLYTSLVWGSDPSWYVMPGVV